MQLILGISADKYVSKGPNDNMKWLGSDDKSIFKLLTLGAHNVNFAASSKTCDYIPFLPGRGPVIRLSRNDYSLDKFYNKNPNGVLLGGQTIAEEAIKSKIIDRVHLCFSPVILDPEKNNHTYAQKFILDKYIEKEFDLQMITKINLNEVYTYDRIKS